MTELLTAAQMRAIETAAIESGEVTGLELMERAGRGVVEAIFEEWPELATTSHRAVVLCGPGNNGGDGFVVARLLKEWGWEVEVFLYGDAEKLPPDAKVNYERWDQLGPTGKIAGDDWGKNLDEPNRASLIIDALFGIGLSRPFLEFPHIGIALSVCRAVSSGNLANYPRVVSVDVPSGLCSDSGQFLGAADPRIDQIAANLTVTFEREKTGHHLGSGPDQCGKVRVSPLHILSEDLRRSVGTIASNRAVKVGAHGKGYINKYIDCYKYSHGHALILSGGSGKTGAARLAARGALRIGAGLVTLGVPPSAQLEVASHITAIMLKRAGDGEALTAVLQDSRINALCLGPGMGVERAAELLPAALASGRSCVLDADALSAIAQDTALLEMLHDKCVLTPHAGEFARIFPDIAKEFAETPTKGPAYSKVDATRKAAKRAGCVVLFKGADTVIAAPNGRCSINSAHYDRAAPWLATAGSGDVLAGFIAGLLARGFTPFQAAETAAWLHVECALSFGPGLIAEDIPEELPKVFRAQKL